MPETSRQQKTEIRLEDLLRLKRAERPEAEFWNRFDRELERRRLQTLVRREPWYSRGAHAFASHIHPLIAAGATAVLLFGLIFYSESGYPAYPSAEAPLEPEANQGAVSADPEVSHLAASGEAEGHKRPMAAVFAAVSRADFGVDVIAAKPQAFRFRAFTTDMEPAVFTVSREQSAGYMPDALRLDETAARVSLGALIH